MTRHLWIAFSILVIQTGCGSEPYPAGLVYPPRADLLVVQLPPTPPNGPPAAGKLDAFIAEINGRGGRTYNPADHSTEQKEKLRHALEKTFGTPAQPVVRGAAEIHEAVEALHLQPDRLAAGSVLYRRHCLQCHGLMGDGRGPTGQWVYPIPRDFRQGIFKYLSTSGSGARKPSRADMQQLLIAGIDRTAMPAFALVSEADRDLMIDYTIYLSLRGEVEFRLLREMLSPDGDVDDFERETSETLKRAIHDWLRANREALAPDSVPTPDDPNKRIRPEHLESIRRGHALFTSPALGCIGCHADFGRQARYLYDSWGGSVRITDLTEGAFRGGKRPIDLFHRIRGGIGPSGMPAATSLSDEQVWDLVHFVLALPVASALPQDVRERVHSQR